VKAESLSEKARSRISGLVVRNYRQKFQQASPGRTGGRRGRLFKHIVNWPDVQLIRVAANGINFEVATMGAGDRLALCLHGFPEHAYSWRHQMPLLARLGYRVWAPNLRGYGATDSPREVSAYKISTLVEDVACLIRAANARETLVLAHDWGGALAWRLAMEQPKLINRLVVLNMPHLGCFARELRRPGQLLKSWYVSFFQLPWLPEFLLGRRQGRVTAELIRRTSRGPARISADDLEVYRANAARPGGLRAMLHWYRAAFRGGELRRFSGNDLPIIRIPTLFLWGDADVALGLRTTRGTEQYVSDLTFRVLPGVSHWIQEEAPEAVNAMLEAWLAGRRVPEYSELSVSA
jgi:epoxide hydrolase 4